MKHRNIETRTCPSCDRPFTQYQTPSRPVVYCSKSCGAKYRAARDGMPVPHSGASIEKLKTFHAAAPGKAPR